MNSSMEKKLGYRRVFYKAGRKVAVSQQISKVRLDYYGADKRDMSRISRESYSDVVSNLLDHGWISLA